MKKSKRLIVLSSLALVMVIALAFLAPKIGAWLTDTKTTGAVTLKVGEVSFTVENPTFISDTEVFVPGQNIVKNNKLTIRNTSNVDSQIRFSYTITYKLDGSQDSLNALEPLLFSVIKFDSKWISEGDNSLPSGAGYTTNEGFYYLKVGSTGDATDFVVSKEYTNPIAIIEELVLDGTKVGNSFANAIFTINFVFQAKQADHVTWSDLGTFNFVTGLAN